MGCLSSGVEQPSRLIASISQETLNKCLDHYSYVVVLKLKAKFEAHAVNHKLSVQGFRALYMNKLTTEKATRLFSFFCDFRLKEITFRDFMIKYALVTKCQINMLCEVLFYLYAKSSKAQFLEPKQFEHLVRQEKNYFRKISLSESSIASHISKDNLLRIMVEDQFSCAQFQGRLNLLSRADLPFEEINQLLTDFDSEDLEKNEYYFVLSKSWYRRWCIHYKSGTSDTMMMMYRSSKNVPKLKRPLKQRQSLHQIFSEIQEALTFVEEPVNIEFDDIEGEYEYQLAFNMRVQEKCIIVPRVVWKLFTQLHPTKKQYPRMALDSKSLDYYPKVVFFYTANPAGDINLTEYTVKELYNSDPISKILIDQASNNSWMLFCKDFGSMLWRPVDKEEIASDCSNEPRFLLVAVKNKEKFYKQNLRQGGITVNNLTVGDTVQAHFVLEDKKLPAYILKISNRKAWVHFIGYSYRYETFVDLDGLELANQSNILATTSNSKKQSVIKGIENVGNTCFINAVVECLVATPILADYLSEHKFSKQKHPLTWALSEMTQRLLKNEIPSAYELKRAIDKKLPVFSGYNQHDAQQFLNMLLDNMHEEAKEHTSVIKELFGGATQSNITCQKCRNVKQIEEKMYILSLPIPQPTENYFSVIVIPAGAKRVRKVVIKLENDSRMIQYFSELQQRLKQRFDEFIYIEQSDYTLKKVRNDIVKKEQLNKKITDIGLSSNVKLYAYEKLPDQFYLSLLKQRQSRRQNDEFRDILYEDYWTICRKESETSIQLLHEDLQVIKIQIKQQDGYEMQPLGTKVSELLHKRIVLRRFNSIAQRYEPLGDDLLAGIPKWASYDDIITILGQTTRNLVDNRFKPSFHFRLVDPEKLRCIFCLSPLDKVTSQQEALKPCCEPQFRTEPLLLSNRYKTFVVNMLWDNLLGYNNTFLSDIEVDRQSQQYQNEKASQLLKIEECLSLFKQPQKVQMTCDECKHAHQTLQVTISIMPNILILHMKQLRYTPEGYFIKMDINLVWQQVIDTGKYSLGVKGTIYQLYAFVRHHGNSSSGHYTCMAKRNHPFEKKKIWVNFDDDLVEIVKTQSKSIPQAYLLFFRRVDLPTSAIVNFSNFIPTN